jgi:hypothetical protein
MRPKLTYSNVVSTICLFLLLGGGAAYAAGHFGKNSVGSKQLKKNAVTTVKIKKEAVTGAKVKKGTLTGKQINAATLGTVPSARRGPPSRGLGRAAVRKRQHELRLRRPDHILIGRLLQGPRGNRPSGGICES